MFNNLIQKYLSDELFVNRTILSGLAVLSLLAGYIVFDNPTVYSISLFSFCLFLIFQTYISGRLFRAAIGMKVMDAIIPLSSLNRLMHCTSAAKALEIICKSYQPVFPVFYNNEFMGIVNKDSFISSASAGFSDSYLADYTDKKFAYTYEDQEIQKLLTNGSLKKARTMIVFDKNNCLVGLLSYEKLVEFLLMEKVIKESKNREVHDEFLL